MTTRIDYNDIWLGHNILASGVEGGIYGSYYHRHLAVRLPDWSPFDSEKGVATFLKSEPDRDKQFEAAMAHLAINHELRHFHDCFGTLAGISLFTNYLSLLRAFIETCKRLSADGLIWRLPIIDWISRADCPSYVREFIRRWVLNMKGRAIYEGIIEMRPQSEPDPRPWEEFILPDGASFPAFPLHVGETVFDLATHEQEASTGRVHWVSIGLNVLLEGGVQAMQRLWLESVWPPYIVEMFETAQKMYGTTFREDLPPDMAGLSSRLAKQPYNITDLLMTKYLKTQHDITAFPRNRIIELTDRALMNSQILEFSENGTHRHPGKVFTGLLAEASWPGDQNRPIVEPQNAPETCLLREEFHKLPPSDEIEESASHFSVIEYIRRYVAHNVIVPMLDLRIKYGDDVFRNPATYASHIEEFPLAPMMIVRGHYLNQKNAGPQFPKWWSRYVMLGEVVEQICFGRIPIRCPRAYAAEMAQGLASFDMMRQPGKGCDHAIKRKSCMTWDPGRQAPLPDCHFNDLTMGLKLRPFKTVLSGT